MTQPQPTGSSANDEARGPSVALLTTMGAAIGALVANLYYAQPLVDSIAQEIGVSRDLAGLVVSVSQIGYGIGLFLLVSLADLVENKRLVMATIVLTTLGLIGLATASSAVPFFIAAFVVGLCSTGAQVLLPFIAHLIPIARRGRVIGNVMGGLLLGVMVARPLALFLAGSFGWRSVFWFSAALMVAIGVALLRMMPTYKPSSGMHYGQILASMIRLYRNTPLLRRRAAYQMLMFAAFNMFWTAAPLMLADHFGLDQKQIALFALAGAGGALSAPIAGRLADRGLIRSSTVGLMLMAGLTVFLSRWAVGMSALVALVVLTILFDAAVQGNQVLSQRIIFSGPVETRGRVNAIYMTQLFFGGAIGSVAGTVTYHWGGWPLTAACGGLAGVAMLLLFVTELRGAPARRMADM
jgi:predicted MFS family arabinose efflux permease